MKPCGKFVLFLVFMLCLLLPMQSNAQQGLKSTRFTGTGNSGPIRLIGSGTSWHKLTWTKSGTVTLCSAKVDSSVDGITWDDGDILGATDCSVNGASAFLNFTINYVRVRVTAWTGTGSVTTVWTGYINNPSPGLADPGGNGIVKRTGLNTTAVAVAGDFPTLNQNTTGSAAKGTTPFTVSVAGAGNGQLALAGNTSGTATITAPDVAGTTTNAFLFSNALQTIDGTAASPAVHGSTQTGTGIYFRFSGTPAFVVSYSGTSNIAGYANHLRFGSGAEFGFSSNADPTAVVNDIAFSRAGALVMALGSGTAGDTSGALKLAAVMSVGTKFTTNNGCGETTNLVGGATAGKITTAGSTSCTTIVTMGNSATAPNGWDCNVADLTTAADAHNPRQSASNATTVTIITGTIVAGDILSFSCIGY